MKETVEDITGGVRDISISLKIWNCEHPSVHPYTSLINLRQPSIPLSPKSKALSKQRKEFPSSLQRKISGHGMPPTTQS